MRRRLAPIVFVTMSLAGTLPVPAAAQITRGERPIASIDPRPESPPGQISSQERRAWMAEQILAPKSLGAGLATAAWQTAIDSPREWSGPSAFSQRFLSNEADTVISTRPASVRCGTKTRDRGPPDVRASAAVSSTR
jgi:hypothetical protein